MTAVQAAALRAFEARFDKEFGDGTLKRATERKRNVVSTGSLLVDHATGVGGLVVGRCYESWGPPSVGKSTMSLIMLAEHQRAFPERRSAWLDVEHTFDEAWAVAHGVDMSRLWVVEPRSAEEVSDEIRRFIDSGFCSMVTVDSIGAMIGKKEIEKDAEEMVVGVVAKIVTRMIRMAAPSATEHQTTFHVVNQIRANIGGYGADTAPGGGNALQHGTTGQLTFKKTGETPLTIGGVKDREIVGKTTNIVMTKNKVAPPMRSAMVTFMNQPTAKYGPVGIDQASEAFQLCERLSLFEDRAGAWYTLHDGTRHNGGDAVKAHLRQHPKVVAEIREKALSTVAHTVIEDEMKEGTA